MTMRLTGALGIVALVLFAALAWTLRSLDPTVVALQLAFTPAAFGAVVHAWTPDQLALYRAHLPWDMLLLLSYGSFGWRLVAQAPMFGQLSASARALARLSLPMAACFDAAENGWHGWLTAAPRLDTGWPYALAASCASLKWLGLLVFALMLAWAGWRASRSTAAPTGGPDGP